MAADRKEEFLGGEWRYVDGPREGQRSKIIDAHFHIFPPLGTDSGDQSGELGVKFFQYHLRDYRTFWRKDDGTRVERLLFEYPSDDFHAMPDVSFRMGNYGQAELTVDGVDYVTQIYPPNLVNMEAPPERMIAEMNLVGVDMGVLQHDHVYGSLNEYFGDCMRRFPGRFIGLAQIWEHQADQPAQHERLERAILEQGNKGLYFSVETFALNGYTDHIDDARFEPLWDAVRTLEIPVWWYLDARRRDRVANFMERVAELDRWVQAHPDIPAVITHGIVPAAIIREIGIPDEVMTLLKRPNVYAEVLFQAKWPDYPFVEGQKMLQRLCEEVGAQKFMWGTDMPYASGYWCTYKQALDFIRIHCDFLSQDEMDLILGGNVARLFNLE